MNKHLTYVRKYRRIIYGPKPAHVPAALTAWIEDKAVEFCLTYRWGNHCKTYVLRKDGGDFIARNGQDAYRILNQYYKVPKAKFPTKKQFSASGVLYCDLSKSGTRIPNCVGYDINSAYTWAMTQDMPDTTVKPGMMRKVGKGEIGFFDYEIVGEGHYAHYIYPRIESPFKRFAEVWYAKKKNAASADEKRRAKDVLNCAIGYLQRTNPVLRTAILSYANQRVKSLIDANTLYCNTDSIVSSVRRPDIEKDLGTGLGQWKIEHTGAFAFNHFTTQWDLNIPTYRGKPKNWFPKGWDLLKDAAPSTDQNIYEFDKESLRIRRKH